jgi:hypothetical protein
MSVEWSYYRQYAKTDEKYLPVWGEGETLATQAVTALNKLIYKWYNDGDVYDNEYYMTGWCNDISSYANWLYYNIFGAANILLKIKEIHSESEYEDLLKEFTEWLYQPGKLEALNNMPKKGTVYKCAGPFKFIDDEDEDDED